MPHGTVLVVDDDQAIRELLRQVLEDEGDAAALALDGKEALGLLDVTAPCVILLDMRMPRMDGWAFAHAYRQRAHDGAPLVCMTAAHDASLRAQEIGAEGALPKPFNLDDLFAVVARFCPES